MTAASTTASESMMPQQRLLLELLMMSGDIAVTQLGENSVLHRTLHECANRGWITLNEISQGFAKAAITPRGRARVKSADAFGA